MSNSELIRKYFSAYENKDRKNRRISIEDGDIETLTKLLGHPPRRCEDFVKETVEEWQQLADWRLHQPAA